MMGEWIIRLGLDLQITKVSHRDKKGDPDNGPMGVMFTGGGEGCVYDAWTASLENSWKPRNPERTWAYEREHNPDCDSYIFYTNAVDELGAFANLQAWLRAQEQPPSP